ncbi:hypothetical protein BUALT_Bualt06G0078000 [Buddleja alternifolia]|uniref:Myb/SANT-like domain-containing protein n=1 Tax=Buddleja alternifolia TaxID=168488 RepID=A0AAV6XK98_9LAMI|nr:hypothetical protein BUALT_Bualt06G0078000 [Buddleja alternifolia]
MNHEKNMDPVIWTPEAETLFVWLLFTEYEQGMMFGSNFRTVTWDSIHDRLKVHDNRFGDYSIMDLKKKYLRIRGTWKGCHDLQMRTCGFSWNYETHSLQSNDALWAAHLVAFPGDSRLRNAKLYHYDWLTEMFLPPPQIIDADVDFDSSGD